MSDSIFEQLKKYTRWLVEMVLIGLALTWLLSQSPIGRDDSDEKGWFSARSGVVPVTDNVTGCQYLRAGDGITPRLNGSGRQVGCK